MSFRKFRFFFYLSLATPLFFFLERLCHCATDGFAVTRITYNLPSSTSPSLPSPLLSTILSQPFTYLASGAQSYVFVSEDGCYVMKFFKLHHLRIPPWLHSLPVPPMLKSYKEKKLIKKQNALVKTFSSYEIAAHLLQEETGLIYLHLYKTPLLQHKIHLIDKIGIHYFLEADSLPFVIQKKGTSFYETLLEDIHAKNLSHAEESITAVLELLLTRCKKGVGDLDPDFRTNFGYIEGHVVQLDPGRFYLEEQEKDPEVYKREIYRITRPLRAWLTEHSSVLASYLDTEVARIKGDSIF